MKFGATWARNYHHDTSDVMKGGAWLTNAPPMHSHECRYTNAVHLDRADTDDKDLWRGHVAALDNQVTRQHNHHPDPAPARLL